MLGPDRPGRLRGMGRGMTATKATWLHVRDKQTIQMQNQISELKAMVQALMKNQVNAPIPLSFLDLVIIWSSYSALLPRTLAHHVFYILHYSQEH